MGTTNYFDTLIAIADDCRATRGLVPPETANPSIAFRTWQLISENPYRYTSDEVIFAVHADRHGIADAERPAAREQFFSKGRPCLRASDLGKKYGWGIHSDEQGRVALYGVGSPEYRALVAGERLDGGGTGTTVTKAMRSKRE